MLARFEKTPENNTFVNTTLKTIENVDAFFACLVQGCFEYYRDGTVGEVPKVCAKEMNKYLEYKSVAHDNTQNPKSYSVVPSVMGLSETRLFDDCADKQTFNIVNKTVTKFAVSVYEV